MALRSRLSGNALANQGDVVALVIEIAVNSDKPIRAGQSQLDVLSATVTFVRSHDHIELRAGGMRRLEDGGTEHVEWLQRELSVGDQILLRVVDSEDSSEPISIERETGQVERQHEREYYEHLKQKYEGQ